MPFIEHFELLNLLHFDVVETWLTRESGSGRKLLLHRYPKASGLRERLQSMPLDELATILKAGEDGDYFFVVTQDTPDLRRFLNWIDKPSTPQRPTEAAVLKADESGTPVEPGEFARIFEAPKISPPHLESPVPLPTAPTATPVQSKPANEPGEFTRMFRTPIKPSPPSPTVPVAEKQGQKITAEPGEFTQMFKGPAVPPQRPAPAAPLVPPASGQEPGEFTRLFKIPQPQTPPAESAKGTDAPILREAHPRLETPQAGAKPLVTGSEPGDFTQMFRQTNPSPPARDASANPRAAAQAGADPGELTRMFKGPGVPPQRPVPAAPPVLPVGRQQPSEFTKLFNNPLPETQLADRLEKPQAEAKPVAPFSESGDFTKIFGRPTPNPSEREASANPLAARTTDLGGVTGIFSNKTAFETATPQAPMAAGPSDYTRIFQPASSPAAAQSEQKPAALPQPAAKKQTQSVSMALVITLAAIAVVAIGIVLYFVVKR